MNQQQWLIDEAIPPDAVAIEQMEREISSGNDSVRTP